MSLQKTTASITTSLTQLSWSSLQMGQLIGNGSYGDVYQATWQGIEVAVKQLHLKTLSGDLSADFQREASIMAQCQFPHIVRLYGVCQEPGRIGMVMEYLPKGSLYQVLHDSKETLPWNPVRWDIAIDMGKGLSYLHSQNIVHRDLKSLNVLLDNQYHAKITDFGLAKIKLETNSTTTKTKQGMGTTRWRAPELFKRGANPNTASDVYSYGMVLWEIASRQLPFSDGMDDATVISWIKDGEQEKLPADCPTVYGEFIQACWKKEPNERPLATQVLSGLTQAKPPEEVKPVETKIYVEKSWHFDPETKAQRVADADVYKLVEATDKDKRKAIQFYQHHPVPSYEISSVQVIYNPNMNHKFALHLGELQQCENNPAFKPKWPMGQETKSDPIESPERIQWRTKVHQQFKDLAKPHQDNDYPAVNLLPMWHGTKAEIVDSICRTGYANLATTDSGFFGKGIYGAYEAEYSYRVYAKKGGALLLNWTATFSTYPVIDGDMKKFMMFNAEGKEVSTGNYSNYDAHFAPVVPANPLNPNETVYYPTKPNQPHTYTELVVFQKAACLPRYLVQLQPTLVKTAPSSASTGGYKPFFPPTRATTSIPKAGVTPAVVPPPTTIPPASTTTAATTAAITSATTASTARTMPISTSLMTNINPPLQPSPFSIQPLSDAPGFFSPSSSSSSTATHTPNILVSQNQEILKPSEQVETASKAAQSKLNRQELSDLLWWVTEGHLVEVEKLLKKNPTLALGTGTITDRSERTFKNITGLQYATWALDAEMAELIIKYAGAHHSAVQMKALAEEPERYSKYGPSYDMSPLINTYQTYFDNYSNWHDYKCCEYWQKEIGGEQRKCPAWLIYAWNEEGKDVAWTKKDVHRKINREYENTLEIWFKENYNNGKGVGSSWAIVRGKMICTNWTHRLEGCLVSEGAKVLAMPNGVWDMDCVSLLGKTRSETLQQLRANIDSQFSQVTPIATATGTNIAFNSATPDQNAVILGEAEYIQGVQLYKKAQYKAAYACFKASAEKHYSAAYLYLGMCYANGQWVEKNEKMAVKYYQLAADQGDTNAQNNLSILLKNSPALKYQTASIPQRPLSPSPSKNPSSAIPNSYDESEKQASPVNPFSPVFSQTSSSKKDILNYTEQVAMASTAAQDKINQKDLSALLKWVTEGHLEEVENLLKKNAALALGTGTVKDLSKRTFKNVTGLQYAAWALDTEMCELIIHYLDAYNASIQLNALANEPDYYSDYGASYDYTPLRNKTKTYVDNYTKWDKDQCRKYWQKEVGEEQRKCPAWLIYAWSEEGSHVAWTEKDVNLPIKREYEKHRLKWWFKDNYNWGKGVGSKWAVSRGTYSGITYGQHEGAVGHGASGKDSSHDDYCVQLLGNTRRQILHRLRANVDKRASLMTTTAANKNISPNSPTPY